MSEEGWVMVCDLGAISLEDVMRFDFGGKSFAVVRSAEDTYHAIDGFCSHEKIHLAEGIVDGGIIECPRHFGVFDYRTGEARKLPACIDLHAYPVRVEDGKVWLKAG